MQTPGSPTRLDDLLTGADTVLGNDVLDRIDEIVAPGTGVGPIDVAYVPPALAQPELRRRIPGMTALTREFGRVR